MFAEKRSSWGDFGNPVGFERKKNVKKKTSSTTLSLFFFFFYIKLGFHINNISCLFFLFSSREVLGMNPLLLSLLCHIGDNNNCFNLHRSHGSSCSPINSCSLSLGYKKQTWREWESCRVRQVSALFLTWFCYCCTGGALNPLLDQLLWDLAKMCKPQAEQGTSHLPHS